MSTGFLLTVSAVGFLMAAFFAGAETAFLAADRIRLRHLADRGDRRARLLLGYVDRPADFLSLVLVGTNLGVIGCTSTFTAVMIRHFGTSGDEIATIILVPTLLVFEEIIPKGVFLYYADRASLLALYPLRFFHIIGYPIVWLFSTIAAVATRLFGVGQLDRRMSMTMEELLFHLKGSRAAGTISGDTMAMVSRALDLIKFTAADVMVPLDRVVMVKAGLGIDAYVDRFAQERFTRMPLYEGKRGNVTGVLSIHNVLQARSSKSRTIECEPPYVAESRTEIVDMLVRMKNQGTHMAMIQDRTGRLIGMTTLEDMLERLVGAIADEFH